jgi:3-oxoacyl-[acyl-carrier protein] reductase
MTEALVAAGAHVLVADAHPRPDQMALVDPRLQYLTADVAEPEAAQRAVATCIETYGRIDAVVNSAPFGMNEVRERVGAAGKRVPFWAVDAETVRRGFDVHAVGSFNLARAATPHFLAQGSGRIVMITTGFSTMLRGDRTPYGPAKAAMEAFGSVMAHDLEGTGVTVNVLVPGHPERDPDGGSTAGVPHSVMAAPIVWLVSDDSVGVTGRRFEGVVWQRELDGGRGEAAAVAAASAPIAWASLDADSAH